MAARAGTRKAEKAPSARSAKQGRARAKAGSVSPTSFPAERPAHRAATVHQAKTHLSRLLAEVEAGGSITITRRGKPVATLEPIGSRPPRIRGSMKGIIAFDDRFFDPLPDDELELWGEI